MAAIVHKCYYCKNNAVLSNMFGTYVCSVHIHKQLCASCELHMEYSIYSVIDNLLCKRCKNSIIGLTSKWLTVDETKENIQSDEYDKSFDSTMKKYDDDNDDIFIMEL